MNFLKIIENFFGCQKKIDEATKDCQEKNRQLVAEAEYYKKSWIRLSEEHENALLSIDRLGRRVDSLQTELSVYKPKTVDIAKAVKELKADLPKTPYRHHTEGRGKPRRDIKLYLRYDPANPLIAAEREAIMAEYEPSTPLETIEAIQKWYYKENVIIYKRDDGENWRYAHETLERIKNRQGVDCEDLTILMNVMYNDIGRVLKFEPEQFERLWLLVTGTYAEVHALNIWLHDDGYFYPVESTMDLSGTFRMKWLRTPLGRDSFYTKFYGLAIRSESHLGANLLRRQFGLEE